MRVGADPATCLEQLKKYAASIVGWNSTVSNLMSKNDHARIVDRHLLESLDSAHLLKASGAARWIDFGSGAGFPAIPLALSGVGQEWLLVDSRRAKVLFLKRTAVELGLDRVDVLHARFEALSEDPDMACRFDGLTSRATALLVETLEMAAPLIRPGGFAFLWKGSRRDEEMAQDESWKASWFLAEIVAIGAGQTAVCKFVRM